MSIINTDELKVALRRLLNFYFEKPFRALFVSLVIFAVTFGILMWRFFETFCISSLGGCYDPGDNSFLVAFAFGVAATLNICFVVIYAVIKNRRRMSFFRLSSLAVAAVVGWLAITGVVWLPRLVNDITNYYNEVQAEKRFNQRQEEYAAYVERRIRAGCKREGAFENDPRYIQANDYIMQHGSDAEKRISSRLPDIIRQNASDCIGERVTPAANIEIYDTAIERMDQIVNDIKARQSQGVGVE